MRTFITAAVPLISVLGLLAAGACEPGKKASPPAAGTAEEFVSTGWEACDQENAASPASRDADTTRLDELLHGVWTGSRTVRDGRSLYPNLIPGKEPNSNYVLIFDMKTRQGLAFEELSPQIAVNAFSQALQASPGAPSITYLYCGSKDFSAFRDRFTKVSDDPADGLRVLARVTGQPVGEGSVADAWARLRGSGYLTRDRQTSVLTAAVYSISTAAVRQASGRTDARWDMVGEYLGSPSRSAGGEPASGAESGVFQQVAVGDDSYLVARPMYLDCPILRDAATGAGGEPRGGEASVETPLRYTKVVIGPFK
jgi:hypothetical protein